MRRKALLFLVLGGLLILSQMMQAAWTTKRLTRNSGWSCSPVIAVDSRGHIHVLWSNDVSGNLSNFELFYARSIDGGTTWTTKQLTQNEGDSSSPALAIDSKDTLHVVYEDDTEYPREIYYTKSANGGESWTTQRLTQSKDHNWYPDIAVANNGDLHVVCMRGALMLGGTPNEVYYIKSTDSGAAWTTKRLTFNKGYSKFPAIATDAKRSVHVVWRDDTTKAYELYYKRSVNGLSWTTKRLSNTNDTYWLEHEEPDIAVDSKNHVHVIMRQDIGYDSCVAYKRSANGGATWNSGLINLTPDSTHIFQQTPYLYVDSSDKIYVAWYDSQSKPFGNTDIHFKTSSDGGASWGPDQRITTTPGSSYTPALAVDSSGRIHLVWEDRTPGNPEIYYAHN